MQRDFEYQISKIDTLLLELLERADVFLTDQLTVRINGRNILMLTNAIFDLICRQKLFVAATTSKLIARWCRITFARVF